MRRDNSISAFVYGVNSVPITESRSTVCRVRSVLNWNKSGKNSKKGRRTRPLEQLNEGNSEPPRVALRRVTLRVANALGVIICPARFAAGSFYLFESWGFA